MVLAANLMTKKIAKKPIYTTPALDKGLDILELLARQTEGLTKSQLARALDRTVSEIFRMLLCLEDRGYIAQADGERYCLTLKMFRLVQEHPPTERLIVEALPEMQHFSHEAMQSCHLGILEGGRVVFLAQVKAATDIGFFVKVGSTADLMETSSGHVILAHQPVAQRARTIAEWIRETGKKPPRDLESHLDSILRTGYERRESYVVKGILNISFPIFDNLGAPLGALSVPYIRYSKSAKQVTQVIELLRQSAEKITNLVGGKRIKS